MAVSQKSRAIENLEEENKELKLKFHKLKGIFEDHRSSKTETHLRASRQPFTESSGDVKKVRVRAHRTSNIEELIGKKDSTFITYDEPNQKEERVLPAKTASKKRKGS